MSHTDPATPPSAFCPHCGEILGSTHGHSHLRSFWSEMMEMGLHFDHRNFRSLPLLFVPGQLPRLWNSPLKARYTPPLKIYVFIALIFFGFAFAVESQDKKASEKSGVKVEIEFEDEESPAEPPLTVTESSPFEKDFWARMLKNLNVSDHKIDQEKLVHRTQKLIFIGLILSFPLVSLMLLVLHRRKALGFWQHMAFVLYTQSSILALASIQSGLSLLPNTIFHIPDNVVFLMCGVFLAIALKRFYQDSWGRTFLKFGPLVVGYFMAVGVMAGLGFCGALLWTLIQA